MSIKLEKQANQFSLLGENINSGRNVFRVDCCCRPSIATQSLVPEPRNREEKMSKSLDCEPEISYLQNFRRSKSFIYATTSSLGTSPSELQYYLQDFLTKSLHVHVHIV